MTGRRDMMREMQEIINSGNCEDLDAPGSEVVHGEHSKGRFAGGRTTPPNSLAVMPDHIFGTHGETVSFRDGTNGAEPGRSVEDFPDDRLESPSKVLGGSTSWTGGLSQGCTSIIRNDLGTSFPAGGSVGSTPKTPTNKLESIKNWTISTYKCSRQTIFERLGKTTRTVDNELETQIEALRDTQKKYSNILRLARALTSHFYHVVQTQSALGEAFSDLAHRSPELQEEFSCNGETQKSLVKHGQTLIGALNHFVSSVNTLCNKTIEDTIITVKQYETARLVYDAYRADLEFYATAPRTDANQTKQRETQEVFEKQKQEFERLRSDVQIKLKFLDENRVKVMHKHLILFHNAVSAYFSGNQKALEDTMKQFSINLKSPNSGTPSWIEK